MGISDIKRTHRQIHIQVDLFKALFSEMNKILHSQMLMEQIQRVLSPCSISMHCCSQPLSCWRALSSLTPTKCFHFCFQSNWEASGTPSCYLDSMSSGGAADSPFPELQRHAAAPARLLLRDYGSGGRASSPVTVSSPRLCQAAQTGSAGRLLRRGSMGIVPTDVNGVGCSLTEMTAQAAACFVWWKWNTKTIPLCGLKVTNNFEALMKRGSNYCLETKRVFIFFQIKSTL